MRLVLTAGFDRAAHVVAFAELAHRAGHEVAAALVVSPFAVRRVRALVRQRGRAALLVALRRLLGAPRRADARPDPMDELFARHDIRRRSIRAWCRAHGVAYRTVSDLNAADAVEAVRASRPDGVVYGGGGILRRRFLEAARGRVINAHSGPLPEVRGMNACEWSILLGLTPCVTIHVIDRGIDTGGVLATLPLVLEAGDDLERLRSKCAVAGVEGLLSVLPRLSGPLPPPPAGGDAHRQCFVMAPAIRQLTERRLASLLAERGAVPR